MLQSLGLLNAEPLKQQLKRARKASSVPDIADSEWFDQNSHAFQLLEFDEALLQV